MQFKEATTKMSYDCAADKSRLIERGEKHQKAHKHFEIDRRRGLWQLYAYVIFG